MKKPPFRKFLSALLATACALSGLTLTTAVGAKTTTDTSAGTTATTATTTETTTTNDPSSFSWDNASVYFLLTDRFKNGNTSNDHSYNRGLDQDGSVVTDIDDRATFHGGDFAGITQTINDGYFDDLGINALWISAPYEQIHGYVVGDNSNPSFAHYSYHGYYVLDYTQTDANFGTAQEFETLVDTAHKHGIRVVIDIVMNHAGYNSIYDMNEYGFGDLKTGWEDDYYSYTKVSNELYHSYIDYDGSSSLWANWWGADWIRCGVSGYTEGGGDNYTMSLSGLPDFKTESTKTVSIPKLLQTKWNKEGRYNTETSKLNSYLSKTGKSMTVTISLS
jgi:alpha-amylase